MTFFVKISPGKLDAIVPYGRRQIVPISTLDQQKMREDTVLVLSHKR
jgi:hypothetical protein